MTQTEPDGAQKTDRTHAYLDRIGFPSQPDEETLLRLLRESQRREEEFAALLEGSRAVMQHREFETAAGAIFDSCKRLTCATAGYVALLTEDGTENDVLFLDPGGETCLVDPTLPMPVRGLREQAYRTGRTILENDFASNEWAEFLPPGHAHISNVLFAPLLIGGIAVGLLGLANKPGGFSQNDARMASIFGELAAIALLNSRAMESLQNSEERFRAVAQSASEAIIATDAHGAVVFWNNAAERILGYAPEELIGKPLDIIIPQRCRAAHRAGMERLSSGKKPRMLGKTTKMVGLRRDGSECPVELSLSTWQIRGAVHYSGIIRDVSEREQAAQEIESLARFPSENRNPVLRIAQDGTIRYANAASTPLLAFWGTQVGGKLPATLRRLATDALAAGESRETVKAYDELVYSLDLVPIPEAGYVNVYGRDVTERALAAESLRIQNRFITTVFESLNHPFYVIDVNDYTVKMANSAAYRGELPDGITCYALTHQRSTPCTGEGHICPLETIKATRQPVTVEHIHYDRDGSRRFYENHGHPIFDDQGSVSEIIEYTLDVTSRRRAEEELQKARDHLELNVQARTAELAQANQELLEVAIHNAELYEAELRARHTADTLSSASLALTQTLELDAVINTLLDFLGQLVPYDSATLMMPRDERYLTVRAVRGNGREEDPDERLGSAVDSLANPHIRHILNTQQSVMIPNTRDYPEWVGDATTKQALSWLGVPLVAGDWVIGICGLEKTQPEFFTQEHLQLAEALVGQSAVAVQNAWLFQQVRAGRERLQSLSQRLVEVQESERRYIARELHDEASQVLVSLKVELRLLEREAQRPEVIAAGVSRLRGVVDSVLENLHRLAMDLRPASLDHLGLVAALRQYAEAISSQHGLLVQLETIGAIPRLSSDVETAVYRIAQEALTNVIRHAQATRADVILERRDDRLSLLIEDNGVGFDPLAADQSGHLGIFGMRERTEMLGGTLVLESSPGVGTTLLLEVPYVDSNSDCG